MVPIPYHIAIACHYYVRCHRLGACHNRLSVELFLFWTILKQPEDKISYIRSTRSMRCSVYVKVWMPRSCSDRKTASVENESTRILGKNENTIWHVKIRQIWKVIITLQDINTLRPRQNGSHFADDTFKRTFLNENVIISIKISLNFVLKGPINNIPALVQIMAWRRSGDKPLSEPMMVSLLTHICVTRPLETYVNTYAKTQIITMKMRFPLCQTYKPIIV